MDPGGRARPRMRRAQSLPASEHRGTGHSIANLLEMLPEKDVALGERDASPGIPRGVVGRRLMKRAEKGGEVGGCRVRIRRGRRKRADAGQPWRHAPRPWESAAGASHTDWC